MLKGGMVHPHSAALLGYVSRLDDDDHTGV